MEQMSLFFGGETFGLPEIYLPTADVEAVLVNTLPQHRPWAWDQLDPDWLNINGDAARLDANIAALERLREIQDGDAVRPEDHRVLSRYTGWGSFPQVFGTPPDSLLERVERVRALLDDDDWDAAKESVLNAHYTSPVVIQAMWKLIRRLGFSKGSILEPGCGVGYFAGFVPDEIDGHFTLVEQDTTSAAIASSLYAGGRGCAVEHQGFEHVNVLNSTGRYFGLVIGNVPFGNYKLGGDNAQHGGFTIHNHFIAKAIDAIHPGGLVALITSSYTLDSKQAAHREWFAERANLVGAIRLPAMAFKRIAGTEVTTDILVFQKPVNPSDIDDSPVWLESAAHHDGWVNRMFLDHPEAVVGELAMLNTGYGKAIGCRFTGSEDDLSVALDAQIERFPQGIFDSRSKAAEDGRILTAPEPRFGYEVRGDDALWRWEGQEAFPVAAGRDSSRIVGMCLVRDAARAALQAQQRCDAAAEREALNTAYDAFTVQYGALSSKSNRRAFHLDPDLPLLLSLEQWDDESKEVNKTDVFWRNTHAKPAEPKVVDVADAAAVSVAMTGRIDFDLMAKSLGEGWTPARAEQEALRDGVVYRYPSGQLVSAPEYLSGDVKTKLSQAREAGEAFAGNVTALEAVIPDDIPAEQIDVQIGASWISASDYEAFCEAIDCPSNISYTPMAGWSVKRCGYAMYHRFATGKVGVDRVLQAAMNGQDVRVTHTVDGKSVTDMPETVAAREKLDALKAAFVLWLWSDGERTERLAREYNDAFNRTVERQYDGSKLSLPGYSWALQPHRHQANAIARIVSESNAMLAHCVGAGKTLTMICGAMEAKRLGRIGKPLFVVPNHMLHQFGAEFLRAYPQARVLLADKDDLAGRRRLEFVVRVATGAWDGVIMTHSTFERVRMDSEFQRRYMEDIIADIEDALESAKEARGNRAVKEIQRALKTWKVRLDNLLAEDRKDNLIAFGDLGVDALFVDEAHLFKNLWRYTRMDRVAGMGSANSQRAFDLLMKVRWMQEQGRGKVVFATGTPVSNTMAEVWVMQHYLQPAVAGEFDPWANRYGRVVTNVEVAPDGSGFRMNRRFAQFVNVPDLMGGFRQVADIQTAEMLKLPVPEAVRKTEVLPKSDALAFYTELLVKRAEKIRGGSIDPRDDNMLLVTSCGRKAALALELVGYPSIGTETKVHRCALNVVRTWDETRVSRGTQMVFCDLSTPGAGWNVYDALKEELVAGGIPSTEIAYIHQAKTDRAKEALFEKVRAGEVRVLIGSTGKMGMGTNVQNRLVALHHLDAPWRPSDVEQREGRILRQGNGNERVAIYRYVTEGSFDAYMWQTLETKATFIAQVMRGDALRTIDDLEGGPLSYAEVKALASGNPMVMEKVRVDSDVARFTMLRGLWLAKQREAKREVALMPAKLETLRGAKAEAEVMAAIVASLPNPWPLQTPTGVSLNDPEAIGKVLVEAVHSVGPFRDVRVGKIGAFTVDASIKPTSGGMSPVLYLRHAGQRVDVTPTATGNGCLGRVSIAFRDMRNLPGMIAERITRNVAYAEQAKRDLQERFEYEAQLETALRRQAEINRELGIADNDNAAVDIAA